MSSISVILRLGDRGRLQVAPRRHRRTLLTMRQAKSCELPWMVASESEGLGRAWNLLLDRPP